MDIDLRRLDVFMPEPKSNDRLIEAMVKQFHSGAVAQGMRGHPLAGEAWAGTRSSQTVFADQMFQGITPEWIATDGREQRPIIVAAPLFQPALQGLVRNPKQRRATFSATFHRPATMCPVSEDDIPATQNRTLRCPQDPPT